MNVKRKSTALGEVARMGILFLWPPSIWVGVRWSSGEPISMPSLSYHSTRYVNAFMRRVRLYVISSDPARTVSGADMVLLCLPGFAIAQVLESVKNHLSEHTLVGSIVSSTGSHSIIYYLATYKAKSLDGLLNCFIFESSNAFNDAVSRLLIIRSKQKWLILI